MGKKSCVEASTQLVVKFEVAEAQPHGSRVVVWNGRYCDAPHSFLVARAGRGRGWVVTISTNKSSLTPLPLSPSDPRLRA